MYKVVSRPALAMESVSGMSLGQTLTQFWLLPHSAIPPGPAKTANRSSAFSRPMGFALKRIAWEIAAGPMKSESW